VGHYFGVVFWVVISGVFDEREGRGRTERHEGLLSVWDVWVSHCESELKCRRKRLRSWRCEDDKVARVAGSAMFSVSTQASVTQGRTQVPPRLLLAGIFGTTAKVLRYLISAKGHSCYISRLTIKSSAGDNPLVV
jgi:hypothetical protein